MPKSNLPPLATVDPAWAWARYEPRAKSDPALLPWDLRSAAHLYRRAGFGADWRSLTQTVAQGPQAAVSRLVEGGAQTGSFYDLHRQTARPLLDGGNLENLPAWWLYAIVQSPHPLLEKMTVFWHGHFATSAAKVDDARLMYAQNELLRSDALGSFRTLVESISKDPAMLLWLDSATNQKREPNENYAREVMELFALGIGNYTEQDIKEAARAFTGWEVRDRQFRFNPRQHDDGEKTVLGQRGNWGGEDAVRIILEQPAAARFIGAKLFRFFISETAQPPQELLEPLARGYRRHDYDNTWIVETILRSNLFFSTYALHQKIKSPVELAAGLVRALELSQNTYVLAGALREMEQGLFFPPNVKGWDGGRAWITTTTMLARTNLLPKLLAGAGGPFAGPHPLVELVQRYQLTGPHETGERLLNVLLAAALPHEVRGELLQILPANFSADAPPAEPLVRLVHAVTALPEYQLC